MADLFGRAGTAIISECGLYRYRLERRQRNPGPVVAFFGVNPSTADAQAEDATTRKWHGFCAVNGWGRYIVGNVFSYRATDVRQIAGVDDPFGPDIGDHMSAIIADADVLIPCWGSTRKVPPRLQFAFDALLDAMSASGKPMRTFGLTKDGDPKHPLMLPYSTPVVEWVRNG